MTEDDGDIVGFGIDGTTGQRLQPEVSVATLAQELAVPAESEQKQSNTWSPLLGDVNKLEDMGWGLVLQDPQGDAAIECRNTEILDALAPLVKARTDAAKDRFKLLYARAGETRGQFLARYRQGAGQIDVRKFPYYLLIVADPDAITFGFQCSLDVQAAVGRLWFEGADALDQYRAYAERVAAGEVEARGKRAVFAGTRCDRATNTSTDQLVIPVHDAFEVAGWQSSLRQGADAARATLLPACEQAGLILIATHGVAYPLGDPHQQRMQGALIYDDWRGHGIPTPDQLLVADDLSTSTSGQIYFLFACFGLGTPRESDFVHLDRGHAPLQLADRARIAPLAQRLLTLGAPAVIGHVERAWGWSFKSDTFRETAHFEVACMDIADGKRIGAALEPFGQRFADTSVDLTEELKERDTKLPDPQRLARLWTRVNDARGYAMLGDPAVRLKREGGT